MDPPAGIGTDRPMGTTFGSKPLALPGEYGARIFTSSTVWEWVILFLSVEGGVDNLEEIIQYPSYST